jgi:hypothetical protein
MFLPAIAAEAATHAADWNGRYHVGRWGLIHSRSLIIRLPGGVHSVATQD